MRCSPVTFLDQLFLRMDFNDQLWLSLIFAQVNFALHYSNSNLRPQVRGESALLPMYQCATQPSDRRVLALSKELSWEKIDGRES